MPARAGGHCSRPGPSGSAPHGQYAWLASSQLSTQSSDKARHQEQSVPKSPEGRTGSVLPARAWDQPQAWHASQSSDECGNDHHGALSLRLTVGCCSSSESAEQTCWAI
ncbi:hypothetical protein BD414DRAFT_499289 [Trametes punicea]|nr:hypothetical protein BD414DRAFT_499289 [Trametes punicea]